MGNFYTNFTLRGPTQQSAAQAMAGRSAFVTPQQADCVVIFDQESDEQDMEVITALGNRLSKDLSCPVLAVLNHDDDILWYQLHTNGQLIDQYDSSPGYFDGGEEEPSGPEGGDARKLCAFGSQNVAAVEAILRKTRLQEGGYVFAYERHAALVEALGIPAFAVGMGFGYVEGGELPPDLEESDLLRVEE